MDEESRDMALGLVAARVRACRMCVGMNIPGVTEAAPGWGNPAARVVVVGQSLCEPCMRTQIPFTGGSGRLLDRAIKFAGLVKDGLFFTNVVHCHPPGNRPSSADEIRNCGEYLRLELEIVSPQLIISLGRDAAAALGEWTTLAWRAFESGVAIAQEGRTKALLRAKHPSYMLRRPAREQDAYVADMAAALVWAHGS